MKRRKQVRKLLYCICFFIVLLVIVLQYHERHRNIFVSSNNFNYITDGTLAVNIENNDGTFTPVNFGSMKSVIQSSFHFDTNKSFCTNGGSIAYDATNGTLSLSTMGKETCYVYFANNNDLSYKILEAYGGSDTIVANGTPNFSEISPASSSNVNAGSSQVITVSSADLTKSIYYCDGQTPDLMITADDTFACQSEDFASQPYYAIVGSSLVGKILTSVEWEDNTRTGLTTVYEVVSSDTSSFTVIPYTIEKGNMYASLDNYGTSYYMRGRIENNYVSFAGKLWRIIRVNGDGSVRMIHNETNSAYINAFNNYQSGNGFLTERVGFYWQIGSARGTQIPSAAANALYTWYQTYISLANVTSKISNTAFCNDRSISNGVGVGSTNATFMPYLRLTSSTYPPTLECPSEDLLAASGAIDVIPRGGLAQVMTYPIGLVTVDELIMAGLLAQGPLKAGTNNYLSFSQTPYWTMSPGIAQNSGASSDNTKMIISGIAGSYVYSASATLPLFPVINIKKNVLVSGGTGTSEDPYVI